MMSMLMYVLYFISDNASNNCWRLIVAYTKMESTVWEVSSKPREANIKMKAYIGKNSKQP